MPWYVFSAIHGPGHQSGSRKGRPEPPEHYHWFPEPLSEIEREELWHTLASDLRNPKGDLTMIDKLPEDVRQAKLKEYKREVEGLKAMIEMLEKGET